MKQTLCTVVSVMLFSLAACASGPQEKKEPAAAFAQDTISYEKAAALWIQTGVTHYIIKVEYGAFSPMSGIWEIEVKDGAVMHWKFKNTNDEKQHAAFAAGLTMDKLFERAKGAGSSKSDKPFKLEASFDRTYGYVKSIAKDRNPEYKKPVPTDQTFLYAVREMKILESKGGASK